MWVIMSHTLQALTKLASASVKFIWASVKQEVFDEIKIVVEKDILLAYPNFNKIFNIHTYAIDYQLSTVIRQEGKPISFYIRKLTGPHNR